MEQIIPFTELEPPKTFPLGWNITRLFISFSGSDL